MAAAAAAAASSTRRILFISSLFRLHTQKPPISSLSIPKPLLRNLSISNHLPLLLPLQFTKTPSLKPHFIHKYTTSSIAIDTPLTDIETETTPSSCSTHPWPEWVGFLEKLKTKGFLDEALMKIETNDGEDGEDGEGDSGVFGISKKELNVLRNAALTFARERFDIYKSLSREHIQGVVECGCPSLFRKAVNSAKRLRATLKLDEGDVCSACDLRSSCDRAYGILKESEVSARTVDVVRMLLIYALDPLVLSGGEKPHGREHIEVSARHLLSELSELSETTPDPALPKPAVKPPKHSEEKTVSHGGSQNAEMKRGDWICSNCHFMNFSRNLKCLECKAEGPKRLRVDDIEMKKGDWTCPQCQFMNFARNMECLRCKDGRPKRNLLPGEWECPSCDFLNYRRNKVCLKCNCDKPHDEVAQYEDQIWRKPR